MKKLFLLLLFSTAVFSQEITVKGCKLLNDPEAQIMTLVIPKSLLKVKSLEDAVEVILYKGYKLSINGKAGDICFKYRGYSINGSRGFNYSSTCMVIQGDDQENYLFVFPTAEPGEYILEVVVVDKNNKTVINQSKSLIAR